MICFKFLRHFIILFFTFSSAFFFSINTFSAEETMKQVQMEMPVLRGDMWIKMSSDEKASFIWGVGHVVTTEKVLMINDPEIKREKGFVARAIEASNNKQMKMREVIDAIDVYYEKNPDKLETPVFQVMWYETIVPRLTVNKQ